jgi:hypothetical protein
MLVAAGGRMAVSPHTDATLINDAVTRGWFVLPGAMTVSEVFTAHRAGAHAVKLFPAAQLGTAYVKALRAVLPSGLSLLAVGGVNPDNLVDFLRAGCAGAGLGGDLYRPGQSARETRPGTGFRRRVARGPTGLTHPSPRKRRRMVSSNSAPMPQGAAALVALDWGSTSLRAFLMDATGGVLADRTSDDGASRLAGGPAEFEKALRRLVAIGCRLTSRSCWPGTAGSQRRREAPYAAWPVSVDALDRQKSPTAPMVAATDHPRCVLYEGSHVADVGARRETRSPGSSGAPGVGRTLPRGVASTPGVGGGS